MSHLEGKVQRLPPQGPFPKDKWRGVQGENKTWLLLVKNQRERECTHVKVKEPKYLLQPALNVVR